MSLEITSVQKLAKVLKILVTITFVCNMIALVLVPGLARLRGVEHLLEGIAYFSNQGENGALILVRLVGFFFASWGEVWTFDETYVQVLTVFLWACGTCTAIILWQARRVLDTILKGETFTMGNAANMKRAGICCLIISAAALARLIWGFCFYKTIAPLLTYNALFVPFFLMGFLLCMVMSALFRQAAEMKEENDLTI